MKQVLDPEAPVSSFRIDLEAKRAIPARGTPPVLNPFDENALEAALRVKDTQDTRITIISMGPKFARTLMVKSLAVGADDLILLEDPMFDSFDTYFTAHTLATAIKKTGEYDIILCGREAADTDAGQVGSGIAELLGIPSITMARKVEVSESRVRVERVVSDGYEVIEAPMPALVTASNEIGELRLPTVKALMEAQKKPVTVWNIEELGSDLPQVPRTSLLKLSIPVREVDCQLIAGKSPEEAGENLALKLREFNII